MKEGRDPFSRARLEAIFTAYNEGRTSYEDIEEAKRKAEANVIEKVGNSSEKKFFRFAKYVTYIDLAQRSHPQDDAISGIDAWVRFKKYTNLPDLPVQIKSSYRDIHQFRKSDVYKRRHGMIIGLNCGPIVSYGKIQRQLSKEIDRIQEALKTDPSLMRYI